MINKILILNLFVVVLLISCDPSTLTNGYNNNAVVNIDAQILNYKDSFNVGDTIKFNIEIPDSIIFNDKMVNVNIVGNDKAHVVLNLGYPDTSNTKIGGYGDVHYECTYTTAIGTYEKYGQINFATINGRFKTLIYIILNQKGVYFIDEIEHGELFFNNGSNITQFHYNFGSINRHKEYVINCLNPSQASNMSIYLSNKGQDMPNEFMAFYVK